MYRKRAAWKLLLVGLLVMPAIWLGSASSSTAGPGDLAPFELDHSTSPPTVISSGDGVVDVSDVLVSLRVAVGLARLDSHWDADLAPGILDETTVPPTHYTTGDGRIDVADVLVSLRAAVGQVHLVRPRLRWEPDHLDVEAGVQVVEVTAIIQDDIPELSLQFTPSIADYVSVDPAVLPALPAGSEVSLMLTFMGAPHNAGGTLHARDGNRTVALPLPVRTRKENHLDVPELGLSFTVPDSLDVSTDPGDLLVLASTVEVSDSRIFIQAVLNPGQLSLEEYFDGDPGANLFAEPSGTQLPIVVAGTDSHRFVPAVSLDCDVIVVVPRDSDFLIVHDFHCGFQSDGTFESILNSLTF